MKNKKTLREYYKNIRKKLDLTALSDDIVQNILEFKLFKESTNILAFFPLKSEVQIQKLFQFKEKNWFLPKIEGSDLSICEFNSYDDLVCSEFLIKEPCSNKIDDLKLIDLIITPCLGADLYGYRLGWGKGYYDRFFEKLDKNNLNPVKILPVFDECIEEKFICMDEFDKKCDYLISQSKIIKTKN